MHDYCFFQKNFSREISDILSSLRYMKEDCFDEPFKPAFEHKKNSREKMFNCAEILNNIDTKYNFSKSSSNAGIELEEKEGKPIKYQ